VEAVEAAALELLEVWVVKVEKVVVGINVAELILLLKDFPCYSIKYELLQHVICSAIFFYLFYSMFKFLSPKLLESKAKALDSKCRQNVKIIVG
jgi:hypothetical protein